MRKTDEDFDEAILDDEAEFKKRFKPLAREERPNVAINKALREGKNRITIYLDADIVEHFRAQAEISKTGYQTLINQTLREKISNPQSGKSADELIERLLQDKNALRKLKAELEAV